MEVPPIYQSILNIVSTQNIYQKRQKIVFRIKLVLSQNLNLKAISIELNSVPQILSLCV